MEFSADIILISLVRMYIITVLKYWLHKKNLLQQTTVLISPLSLLNQLIAHLFLVHKARRTVAFPRTVVTKIRAKVAISILARFSSRSISGLFGTSTLSINSWNSVWDVPDVRFISVSRLFNIRIGQLSGSTEIKRKILIKSWN